MEFLHDYKVTKRVQSKTKAQKSTALAKAGNKLMEELALTENDIQNIFDILEEELPEL
jgi:hypothetical protein